MNILIIGSGGREHALAWKCAQSPQVDHVYVAPGNAGTDLEEKVSNVAIDSMNINELIRFATRETIDLTIVGPEGPLAAGIVDQFTKANLKCFGPTQAAAQLEASKDFAKAFMLRHEIPTAAYESFTDIQAAKDYVKSQGTPIVIKADGLAAGKGVVIAQTEDEAFQTIDAMLGNHQFGLASAKIVIEEFLTGEEVSFIVMLDGENILPLATSQDHKTRDNDDKGPNTGGMGAFSPATAVSDTIYNQIMDDIINRTVNGLAKDDMPYQGFLYAGVIITNDGPKLLEYNCRFGDPETQPILMRLQSDFVDLCMAAMDKKLNVAKAAWDPKPALTVVLASGGYPGNYTKGHPITGLPLHDDLHEKVFHAGTTIQNGQLLTNGGRVLGVTTLGHNVKEAKRLAYEIAGRIQWNGVYYRTDIGAKALSQKT